jgi:hypothetical protein
VEGPLWEGLREVLSVKAVSSEPETWLAASASAEEGPYSPQESSEVKGHSPFAKQRTEPGADRPACSEFTLVGKLHGPQIRFCVLEFGRCPYLGDGTLPRRQPHSCENSASSVFSLSSMSIVVSIRSIYIAAPPKIQHCG